MTMTARRPRPSNRRAAVSRRHPVVLAVRRRHRSPDSASTRHRVSAPPRSTSRLATYGRNEVATEPPPTTWQMAKGQIANPMNIMLLIVSDRQLRDRPDRDGRRRRCARDVQRGHGDQPGAQGDGERRRARPTAGSDGQGAPRRHGRGGRLRRARAGRHPAGRGRRPRSRRRPHHHLRVARGPGGVAHRRVGADRQGQHHARRRGAAARRPDQPRLPEHPGHPGLGRTRRRRHRASRPRWARSPNMVTATKRTKSPLQIELDGLTKIFGFLAWGAVAIIAIVGIARDQDTRDADPALHVDGDLGHPDRAADVRAADALVGRATARRVEGGRQVAQRRRDARRHHGDQQRQDRHADDERHDVGHDDHRRLVVQDRGQRLREVRAPSSARPANRHPTSPASHSASRCAATPPSPTTSRSSATPPRPRSSCSPPRSVSTPRRHAARLPRVALVPFDSEYKFMATFHDRPAHLESAAPARTALHDRQGCTGRRHRPVLAGAVARRAPSRSTRSARTCSTPTSSCPRRACASSPSPPVRSPTTPCAPPPTTRWARCTTSSLVSLVGIIDPLRPSAVEAVRVAHGAGIDVRMITGDHTVTARAIADQLGLGPGVITGTDLQKLSDDEVKAQLPAAARLRPGRTRGQGASRPPDAGGRPGRRDDRRRRQRRRCAEAGRRRRRHGQRLRGHQAGRQADPHRRQLRHARPRRRPRSRHLPADLVVREAAADDPVVGAAADAASPRSSTSTTASRSSRCSCCSPSSSSSSPSSSASSSTFPIPASWSDRRARPGSRIATGAQTVRWVDQRLHHRRFGARAARVGPGRAEHDRPVDVDDDGVHGRRAECGQHGLRDAPRTRRCRGRRRCSPTWAGSCSGGR